jgi:hypothetical protein
MRSNTPVGNNQDPRRGEKILASDIAKLNQAVKRLSKREYPDRFSAFSQKKQAFEVSLKIEPSGGEGDPTYKVSVGEGYVVERQVMEDPSLKYHEVDKITYDGGEVTWLPIEAGQAIYVFFECDKKGVIQGVPDLLVDDDDKAHEHWKPEGFQFGGADGSYYYKLAVFELPEGNPRIKNFHTGENIDHYSERVNFKNKEPDVDGELRPIGHIYEEGEDIYWLKTAVQLSGQGQPIIMPLPDGETKDSIESIQFRRIKELETQAQIQVLAEDGDAAITIRGNEYDDTIADARKITISVKDGLVTSMSKVETNGWWGTVSAILGNGDLVYSLGFEDGILTSVSNYGGVVAGTQASPGSVGAVVSG